MTRTVNNVRIRAVQSSIFCNNNIDTEIIICYKKREQTKESKTLGFCVCSLLYQEEWLQHMIRRAKLWHIQK